MADRRFFGREELGHSLAAPARNHKMGVVAEAVFAPRRICDGAADLAFEFGDCFTVVGCGNHGHEASAAVSIVPPTLA